LLKELRINNQIRSREVKLIGETGEQLGIVPVVEALKLAREKDLDLVEVGPNVQPPIAKLMDYGKYKYQKARQERKSSGKPKEQEMKTVRIGFKTGVHDLDFKAKQIDEFLKEGYLVKIELTLRGREKALAPMGRDKLINFLKTLTEPNAHDLLRRSPFGWITVAQKVKKQNHENKQVIAKKS